jgi:glycine cleavage system transcriptional repressor
MNGVESHWYMLTLVGKDAPGIVAGVTSALAEHACNLGETSMIRLGGSFTIMMMVETVLSEQALSGFMQPVAVGLGLRLHIDPIEGHLHNQQEPDVIINVHGADRVGIVASVTTALATAGLNILDLSSDVGGKADEPFYIMSITGQATKGMDSLEAALEQLKAEGVEAHLQPVELMIG